MLNDKKGISLIVLVLIAVVVIVIGSISIVLVMNNDNNNGTNPNNNLNNGNIGNSIVENEDNNTNNQYDVITEKIVRNHKKTQASDFEYAEVSGGIEIRKYTGNDAIVVIPETIEGEKVVAIGYTFANDSTVRGIYVPNTVKKSGVFGNNNDLEVVIFEEVEEILDNAFNSCTKLHTVVLGNSLKSIGENAFFYCVNLKELYIAPTLINIDEIIAPTIFYLCDKLTITGEKGSYIENFCNTQNISFVAE